MDEDGDDEMSAEELKSYGEMLSDSRLFLQCYRCPDGSSCRDPKYAKKGLMIEDVEALPGFWNRRDWFFESRDVADWGPVKYTLSICLICSHKAKCEVLSGHSKSMPILTVMTCAEYAVVRDQTMYS